VADLAAFLTGFLVGHYTAHSDHDSSEGTVRRAPPLTKFAVVGSHVTDLSAYTRN